MALIHEFNRDSGRVEDLYELRQLYKLPISDVLLQASIEPWEQQGLLSVSRYMDGTIEAHIKSGRYGSALGKLLNLINATSFDVNWKKEEILTDAAIDTSWPGLPHWKIFRFSKEAEQPTGASEHNIAPSLSQTMSSPQNIDLTKWGTILAALGIIVTIVLWKFS